MACAESQLPITDNVFEHVSSARHAKGLGRRPLQEAGVCDVVVALRQEMYWKAECTSVARNAGVRR
jgi:hypothetical protein